MEKKSRTKKIEVTQLQNRVQQLEVLLRACDCVQWVADRNYAKAGEYHDLVCKNLETDKKEE